RTRPTWPGLGCPWLAWTALAGGARFRGDKLYPGRRGATRCGPPYPPNCLPGPAGGQGGMKRGRLVLTALGALLLLAIVAVMVSREPAGLGATASKILTTASSASSHPASPTPTAEPTIHPSEAAAQRNAAAVAAA